MLNILYRKLCIILKKLSFIKIHDNTHTLHYIPVEYDPSCVVYKCTQLVEFVKYSHQYKYAAVCEVRTESYTCRDI